MTLADLRRHIAAVRARPWYRDKARHLRNLEDEENRLLRREAFSYRQQGWRKAS